MIAVRWLPADDVVSCEEDVLEPLPLEAVEGLHRATVIVVPRVQKGDEEAHIDEDQIRAILRAFH